MKKILVIFILVLLPVIACSQSQIFFKDTATLQWNDDLTDENGIPLSPTDSVEYEIFLYNSELVIDDQDTANLNALGTSTDLEFVIDFTGYERALYWAGVRSKITREDLSVFYSDIAWSHDEVATLGNPFGYVRTTGVLRVKTLSGLRDSGI